jgi:hypothetical protein
MMSYQERKARGLGAFFATVVFFPVGMAMWFTLIWLGAHIVAAIVGY